MGHPDPASDRLIAQVAARRLASVGGPGPPSVRISIEFGSALAPEIVTELEIEAARLSARRGPGLLVPRRVSVDANRRAAHVTLDRFDDAAVRLDVLLGAVEAAGSAFGSPLAALLIGATAARLRTLHAEGLAHADLSPRHILVGPGGGVALIGPGLPLARALMVPAETKAGRGRRRAPELWLGAAPSPSSDVYALAALYYELLAGQPYRGQAGVMALEGAARAGLPPELPGALPDPRPTLVAFLRSCLEADRALRPAHVEDFLEGLKSELGATGIPLADRATLAGLIEEYLPDEVVRGPNLLIDDGDVLGPRTTVTALPGGGGSKSSDWAAVLGETTDFGVISADITDTLAAPPAVPEAIDPAPSPAGGLRLPSVERPGHPDAAPPAPARLPNPKLEQLQAPSRARPAPTLEEATRLSPKAFGVVGLVALVLVGLLAGISALRGEPEPDPVRVDRSMIPPPNPRADAGVASGPNARPVKSAKTERAPASRAPAMKPLGLVSVMSQPSGATVLIDGGYVGKTPLVLKHDLDHRKAYTVDISADGFEPWSETLRPKKGSLSVVARLVPED